MCVVMVIPQLSFFNDVLLSSEGTIASKINFTPKGDYLPISKLHSIIAVANLLAHNNISQICYCGQISLQSAAVNFSFSSNLTHLGYHLFCWIWYICYLSKFSKL